MPRSTLSTALLSGLLVALAVALTGCVAGPTQTVFTGRFSAVDPIRLTNKTITGGRYLVGYSMQVLFSTTEPVTLACSVIDTNGIITGLNGMSRTVPSGKWTNIEVENTYELPDLTLGIRCVPNGDALLTAVFRNVKLSAEQVG